MISPAALNADAPTAVDSSISPSEWLHAEIARPADALERAMPASPQRVNAEHHTKRPWSPWTMTLTRTLNRSPRPSSSTTRAPTRSPNSLDRSGRLVALGGWLLVSRALHQHGDVAVSEDGHSDCFPAVGSFSVEHDDRVGLSLCGCGGFEGRQGDDEVLPGGHRLVSACASLVTAVHSARTRTGCDRGRREPRGTAGTATTRPARPGAMSDRPRTSCDSGHTAGEAGPLAAARFSPLPRSARRVPFLRLGLVRRRRFRVRTKASLQSQQKTSNNSSGIGLCCRCG